MNPNTSQRAFLPGTLLPLVAALALMIAPQIARASAADGDSGQTVECMLPGQIHSVGGQATLGARRPIQTSPEDCRQRGGEYTVDEHARDEHASQPHSVPHVPMANAGDGPIIACLLPVRVRQLGEKVRYKTVRRTIHTTQSDCETRGGRMIVARRAPRK